MQIEKGAPVLVTGASGYIASWVVKQLLQAGHTVHATVRDPARAESVAHLEGAALGAPGTLVLFKADLLAPRSFDAAMAGCQVVIHTASPFVIGGKGDPERTLLAPALEGTRNVLDAVERTPSVRRVVLTSSVASVYGDAAELAGTAGGRFDETHWNDTSSLAHNPYPFSKVEAERAALARSKTQARWDLVCINPSFVLGPSLTKHSDSYSIETLTRIGRGRYRTGVPKLHFGCVDVRDVADAHLRAAFTPGASGRYIVSAGELWMLEIADALRARFGKAYSLPTRSLSKALVWLLGPISAGISRRFVSLNVGFPVRFDNTKGVRELGLHYRPLSETIQDHFQQLIDDGVIKSRKPSTAAQTAASALLLVAGMVTHVGCATEDSPDDLRPDASSGVPDSSLPGTNDAGTSTPLPVLDAGGFDAGTYDAGARDGGFPDAGAPTDAGRDAASSDGAIDPGPGVCGGSTPHGCWKPKAGNDPNCPPQIHEQSALYPPAEEWVACSSPYYQACIYLRPDGTEANCACDLGLHWLCSY